MSKNHRSGAIPNGPAWAPRGAVFEHGPDGSRRDLRRLLRAPVQYGARTNRLLLRPGDLDRPLRDARDLAAPFVEQHLSDLLDRMARPLSLIEQVRGVIAAELGNGPLTVPHVAAALRLSPRTLQRHLAAAGTSLRSVVQERRRETATRLLGEARTNGEAMAARLGYADVTACSRAFRHWTGMTMRDFRHRD